MLGPGPGVVSGLFAASGHGGDLHLVPPPGGALHRQAVADVDADMPGAPNGLTGQHGGPAGGAHVLAQLNHAVRPHIRAGPGSQRGLGGVGGPAVGPGGVTTPSPQHAFDEVDTIEAVHGWALIGGGLNHPSTGSRFVVVVIAAVASHVVAGEGCPKAPHDIERLVVLGDVHHLVHKGLGFHFAHGVISSFSLSVQFQRPGGRCPPRICPQSG